MDPFHVFAVNITAGMVPFFNYEAFSAGLFRKVRKHSVIKTRTDKQIIVMRQIFFLRNFYDGYFPLSKHRINNNPQDDDAEGDDLFPVDLLMENDCSESRHVNVACRFQHRPQA